MSTGKVEIGIKNENELKIEINNNISFYNYNELVDYDRNFKYLRSVKEIYFFILPFIGRKAYEIKDGRLILKSVEKDIVIPVKNPFSDYLNNSFNKIIQIQKKIDANLHQNKLLNTIKVIQDKGEVFSLCNLKDGRLVSGSRGGIVVYNKDTYNPDFIIKEYPYSISVLRNGYLVSATAGIDAVCIWEIDGNGYKLVHKLKGDTSHTSGVNKVIEMEDGRLCSCSEDKTIKIWDENYQCVQTLTGHTDYVMSVIEMNDYLISVGNRDDSRVIIWNKSTYKSDITYKNIYCCWSNSLSKLNKDAVIIGGQNKIIIIDVSSYEKKELENSLIGNVMSVCVLRGGRVLIGNHKGNIVCFDSSSDQIVFNQHLHNEEVYCIIESEDNQIFSSSQDKTINIYYKQLKNV